MGLIKVLGEQATDAYDGSATVKEYNKGLSLMKAGYTIYLAAVGIFLFMVISGPLLNRLSFGRPTSMRSATMVSSFSCSPLQIPPL